MIDWSIIRVMWIWYFSDIIELHIIYARRIGNWMIDWLLIRRLIDGWNEWSRCPEILIKLVRLIDWLTDDLSTCRSREKSWKRNWLIDWWMDWPIRVIRVWLNRIGPLSGQPNYRSSINQSFDENVRHQSIGCSINHDQPINQSIITWLMQCISQCCIVWLIWWTDWSMDWLIDALVDWLIGGLTDTHRLIDRYWTPHGHHKGHHCGTPLSQG